MEKDRVKLLTLFIVIYVIVILVIIWYIWIKPKVNTSVEISQYTVYTEEQAKDKFFDIYSQEIIPLFMLGYSDIIYDKVDENFLKDNSLNKQNFKEYLQNNGYLVLNITNGQYVTSKDKSTYTYTCKYVFNNIEKIINIIEKKPYDYKISFENKIYGEPINVVGESDNLLFNIEETNKEVNRVTYKITITNKGTSKAVFKFDNATDVKVGVIDQGEYPISSFVSLSGLNELEEGTSITRTYTFDIPVIFQNLKKQMMFYNVKINGETKNIIIAM